MALGSVVGGILLVVSVVVVARDLQHKNPKKTSLVAGGDTTTVPALGQEDTSTTGVSVPGLTIVSPTSAPGAGAGVPTLAPVVTTAPPATQPVTTTTMPPGPPAGGGTSILQGKNQTLDANGSAACNGFLTNKYLTGDPQPACGDTATGDNGKYHLYWVIEPATSAGAARTAQSNIVSVWGQDQSTPTKTWTLKLQGTFPLTQFQAPKPPIPVSMAAPSGFPQLAFGFHDPGGATSVHVDVVQVSGSGPGAAVTVGVHVDANLANASLGRLDAYNNGSHQVIIFYKGAWRVQRQDTGAAGPTNL